MFALSIALLALSVVGALAGIHTGPAALLWLACVAISTGAMVQYWRNHKQH